MSGGLINHTVAVTEPSLLRVNPYSAILVKPQSKCEIFTEKQIAQYVFAV